MFTDILGFGGERVSLLDDRYAPERSKRGVVQFN
jgi:hypothetical protein